ncbi:hypothetical protein BC834DRAFT_974942 [Gloeopeniophorella convolvens]|nr:hypothetical protein BC834DRAFT_974942 [Gloeopeniophorella convolvens]
METEPCLPGTFVQGFTGEAIVQLESANFGFYELDNIPSAVCFGAVTSLTIISISLLSQKSLRNMVVLRMFIVIVIMYLNSLAHFVAMHYELSGFGEVLMGTVTHQKWLRSAYITISWPRSVEGSAALVNVLLSDIIVMWRAWLIWDKSKRVLAASTILSLATVAVGIWSTITEGGITSRNEDLPNLLFSVSKTFFLCVLSLASNLWAFVLIAWKAWYRRRLVKDFHNEGFRGSPVGRTLALLLESGGVYSLLWASYIAVIVSTRVPNDRTISLLEEVLAAMVAYVTAMYPNAILLIADLQKSAYNETFACQTLPRSNAAGPSATKYLADLLEGFP